MAVPASWGGRSKVLAELDLEIPVAGLAKTDGGGVSPGPTGTDPHPQG